MIKYFTFLLILFGLMISSGLNAQTTISGDGPLTFSTPGNFDIIIPADCTADITYEIWGGGGGGGFINTANANTPFRAAPGGGGGGYSTGTIIGQSAGTYTLTVGAGGIVTSFATTRQNGEDSSVFGVTSTGGQGGGGTGAGNGGTGDVTGGVGGLRNGNATSGIGGGGGGGSGSVVTNGTDAVGAAGGAGGTPNGGDGSNAAGNGTNGTSPGGGGGGKGAGGAGLAGFTSGDGADGQITLIVSNYTCLTTVPTLGEWGLITLALLLLTTGLLFLTVPQMKTPQGQQVSIPLGWNNIPFHKKLYFQILPIVALAILVFFAVIVTWFGYEWTSADPLGILMTVPLMTYILMLVVQTNRE